MPNNTATTNPNAITHYQPSENTGLSRTLWNLEDQFGTAARENITNAISAQGGALDAFTDLEVEAMVQTEKLRMVNGMDLAAILLRGKILKDIEDRALFSVHPNQYRDLTHLAQEQGISVSELSDIRTLTWIIFPWIEENLQVPIAQVWETVGKSKFRLMTPVLKALITGDAPDTESARRSFERILDTTAIEMRSEGEEPTEQVVRVRAARALIDTARMVPARELTEHIRDGEVTPALTPTIVVMSGRRYLLSEVNEDQLLVMRRKLGRHMADPDVLELPRDARQRQREALSRPLLRAINRFFEVE